MAGGYFKIWRSFFDDLIMQDPITALLFVVICGRANWKDGEEFFGRSAEPVSLKRGQLLTGRHALHRAVYPGGKASYVPSESTLWKRLLWLEKKGAITLKTNSMHTIVTLVNYATYQDSPDESEQRANSELTANEQQTNSELTHKKKEQEQGRTEKKVKKQKAPQAAVVFPPALDVPEFREAWAEWEKWRRTEKKKPLTVSSRKSQLALLETFGAEKAIRSIESSIRGDYQGLFDPDGKTNARKTQPGAVHDPATAGTQITF